MWDPDQLRDTLTDTYKSDGIRLKGLHFQKRLIMVDRRTLFQATIIFVILTH